MKIQGSYNMSTGVWIPPDYGPPKRGLTKISPNCYKGAPVRTLEDLSQLTKEHKAVAIQIGQAEYKISSACWIFCRKRASDIYDDLRLERIYHCVKEEDLL